MVNEKILGTYQTWLDNVKEADLAAELQACDDLVQGAVPAAGNDKVRLAGMGAGKVRGVAAPFGDIDGAEVIRLVEDGDHLGQKTPGLTGAGVGADE